MKLEWEVKKLGDLFDITSSKRVFESEWKSEGVPFYRAREIVKLSQKGFVDNELFISEDMFNRYSEKYGVPVEGDIMVTGVGTLGICYRVRQSDKFYFKDGNIIWLKKKSEVNSRFVEYAFKSDYLREQIDNSVGATVGTYTIIKAKNTLIPVPSLSEQKRIVAILDDVFQGLAVAAANAEKNLKNARELFESYLTSVFTQKGEGWVDDKLGSVCEKITDGTHQTPTYHDSGYVFLSSRNVTSGSIDWVSVKFIDEKQHKEMQRRVSPKLGDILLAKNGTTGVAAVVDRDVNFDIYVSLALIRPQKRLSSSYLLHFINSPIAKKQFNKRLKGIGVPNLHLEEIREVVVSYPKSLQEQERCASEIDVLRERTRQLEGHYRSKLAAITKLRRSILNKAFSGELVMRPTAATLEAVS